MNKDSAYISQIFDSISHRYDTLNVVLSGGLHKLWTYKFLKVIQPLQNLTILDVATGTGEVPLHMIHYQPKHIWAIDISEKMIDRCMKKLKKYNKYDRITCLKADAMNLPFHDDTIDLITVAFGIRNIEEPLQAIKEFHRVLKPNGRLVLMEFFKTTTIEKNLLIKFYIQKIMPAFGNVITRNKSAYSYLTDSIYDFYTPNEFAIVLSSQHFQVKQIIPLHLKLAHIFCCVK